MTTPADFKRKTPGFPVLSPDYNCLIYLKMIRLFAESPL